jgi:rod shape-determining protein MreC
MDYSPPPLFRQGPPALVRLAVLVVLALALLISDARFRTLETVRAVLATGLYPLQRAALVPRDVALDIAQFFASNASLRTENARLAKQNLQLSLTTSQLQQADGENRHLRDLLQLQQRSAITTVPAEIQYDTRDPFTQKVIVDHGTEEGVQNGAPVVNENGLVGQVTRVYPYQSEVTLLTDKDQAVPVQLVRTGIRSVIYGTPRGDTLDLRFVPVSADVKAGDLLVTSGLDGIYPAGLPVARVARVDRQADTTFARVVCEPLVQVRGARQLLILHYQSAIAPRPDDQPASAAKAGKSTGKSAVKGAVGGAVGAASGGAIGGAGAVKGTTKGRAKEATKETAKGTGKAASRTSAAAGPSHPAPASHAARAAHPPARTERHRPPPPRPVAPVKEAP